MMASISVSDAECEFIKKKFESWRNMFVNYRPMVGFETVGEIQACLHGSDGVYVEMKVIRKEVKMTSVMYGWVRDQTGEGCSWGWARTVNVVAEQRGMEPMDFFQELLLSLCGRLEEGGKAFLEDLLCSGCL